MHCCLSVKFSAVLGTSLSRGRQSSSGSSSKQWALQLPPPHLVYPSSGHRGDLIPIHQIHMRGKSAGPWALSSTIDPPDVDTQWTNVKNVGSRKISPFWRLINSKTQHRAFKNEYCRKRQLSWKPYQASMKKLAKRHEERGAEMKSSQKERSLELRKDFRETKNYRTKITM